MALVEAARDGEITDPGTAVDFVQDEASDRENGGDDEVLGDQLAAAPTVKRRCRLKSCGGKNDQNDGLRCQRLQFGDAQLSQPRQLILRHVLPVII